MKAERFFSESDLSSQARLLLSLSAHQSDFVRILIDEVQPIKPRYRVPDVIVGEQRSEPWDPLPYSRFWPDSFCLNALCFLWFSGRLRVEEQTEDFVILSWSSRSHHVRVWRIPFRLEILCEQKVMVTFNYEDKLRFESLQHPPRWGPRSQWCTIPHKSLHLNMSPLYVFCADLITRKRGEKTAYNHQSVLLNPKCSLSCKPPRCLLQLQEEQTGSWKETFKEFVDVKANGLCASWLCLEKPHVTQSAVFKGLHLSKEEDFRSAVPAFPLSCSK